MNIRRRILFTMVLLAIGCGLAVLFSSIIQFNSEISDAMESKVVTAKTVVEHEIEKRKTEAHLVVMGMISNPGLIEAIESGDRERILKAANDLLSMTNLDYCTIRDSEGRVIALTHDPSYVGEDAMVFPHIVSAYEGRTEADLVKGITIPLAISAGAQVHDFNGELLGVIALGFRLDNQEFAISLNELTGCEITFFVDDERISSTLINEDGSYVLGTDLDPSIWNHVSDGETFLGRIRLFGSNMLGSYSPLINRNGDVLGVVFVGYFTDAEIGKLVNFILIGVLITFVVFGLCILAARYASLNIERRMAALAQHEVMERLMTSRYEYSKKLTNALAHITKSPNIPAGDIKAAAEIIAMEGCLVLNVNRISIWSLTKDGKALENITCYERSTGEYSVHDNFDLKSRTMYANLLRSERLIIASNTSESDMLDDGYNPNLCAMLEAPIRIDGELVGLVCADLDRSEEFPESRDWLMEEQSFVSSLADLMALAISGFERRKAREDAEIANHAKSSFLANMSHEIRTPMNSILGVTDILMQKEILQKDVEDGLNRIYASCDMLLGIINDILDFSKIEAGKMEISPAQYVTASLINDSVQLNMTRINEKPIEFEVQVDEMVPAKLIGDELRIKQILNNLLSNAFKFTDSGKVILSVVSEPLPEDDIVNLVLVVRDTGRGMTERQMNKLFEEYSRFDDFFGAATEGTGLGLAITHRLTALMNGGIQVDSKLGEGSMFAVRLPQKTVDDKTIGKNVADHLRHFRMNYVARNRRGQIIHDRMPYGRVLVVDDVEANLYIGIGLMKPYGLQIETVMSGFETIDLIKSGKEYDIIFMDHMMPELDGMKTTEMLRDMGYTKPIVALTANAVAGQADVFIKNGFDDFISKPIDIRQLDSVLRKLVRDKHPLEAGEIARNDTETSNKRIQQPDSVSIQLTGRKIEGLDIIKGLERYHNDEATYLSILRSYMTSVDSMLDSLENFNADELSDYTTKVHGIKGAGRDIFAENVSSKASDLEDAAKDVDVSFIINNNPAFIETARKFVNELKDLFADIDNEKSKLLIDEINKDTLASLLTACRSYNLNNAEEAMSEIEEYNYQTDAELAKWLREKIDLMAFSEIDERLSVLLETNR